MKVSILKQVEEIEEIIISSNSPNMLAMAANLGVKGHKRADKYCTSECSGSDLYVSLAEAVKTDLMLMTFCVTPFVSKQTYEKIIRLYREIDNDSISTVYNFKHYIWHNNKPVNHDYGEAPPTQSLPDYYIPTFGIHLIDKHTVLKNKNVIGANPYFYEVDQIEAIDIDTPYDFLSAELIYKESILSSQIAQSIIARRKEYAQVQLLDCTIRDGGYLNNWNFSDEEVLHCYKAVSQAGYNYFEIGFRSNWDKIPNMGKWCYSLDEDINKIVKQYKGCKIAVMVTMPTISLEDFQEQKKY